VAQGQILEEKIDNFFLFSFYLFTFYWIPTFWAKNLNFDPICSIKISQNPNFYTKTYLGRVFWLLFWQNLKKAKHLVTLFCQFFPFL
jgi:hypothetical protein